MFRKFMSRMYQGNPDKEDLKKEDLKEGRIKLFFTVMQIRFWQLIHVNVIYALFSTPHFLLFYIYLGAALKNPKDASAFFLYILLLIFPLNILLGPAIAGFTNVIMKWAADEHAWAWADFKEGIKKNWKQSMVIMAINGIMSIMFYINFLFYGSVAKGSFFYQFLLYTMVLIVLLYALMNMFIFPLIITYKLKIGQIFKNSFLLTMINLPVTIGVFLISLIIFLAIVVIGEPLAFAPVYILGYSLPAMLILSYVNYILDKYAGYLIDVKNKKVDTE